MSEASDRLLRKADEIRALAQEHGDGAGYQFVIRTLRRVADEIQTLPAPEYELAELVLRLVAVALNEEEREAA